ncbi:peroxiredoxin family protein [Rhodopirellula rubra]|uniref:Peroxiredoxin family protein n=1 Tax=Aporhodopirellula rubra TaxID=980271 RepID=A0A7W5E591_9BACT|nr:DsrE/DsrF/DrsH-like family protein [Aporhodopirellula rubra]MBB3210476.1 peroxiredoxin family protein [Aporhodopirellula rubra]
MATIDVTLNHHHENAEKPQDSFSERLEDRIERLEQALRQCQATQADSNKLNLLVFSGYRDRLLASFVMATGAAACGMEVTMFFTFWGTAALRKGGPQLGKKSLVERAFGMMLPNSFKRTKLSQMDMGGMGRLLMDKEMKKKNIANLDDLIATAAELGVSIRVCEMSMNLMGIRPEELIDYPGLEFCGVASFVDDCSSANTTLSV